MQKRFRGPRTCVWFTVISLSNLLRDSQEAPSHLSTNCLVLPGRISQYQSGPDTVPVCRRDIQRDGVGLSPRDRQADGGEHCMITVWEPRLPADALFPPVSATALCVIHVLQLSIFPLLQSNFPTLSGRGRKEEKKKKGQRDRDSGHSECPLVT